MVAYLTRIFGFSRLELAEDVTQDALARALETWPIDGVPDNPSAWLMRVARNRAIDLIKRDDQFRYFTPELSYMLDRAENGSGDLVDFDEQIRDGQLRMIFSCCHPDLSVDAQVTLILKTLGGFSVAEIAHAFLTNSDTIEKRLARAKKLYRDSGALVEITNAAQVGERIDAVHEAIYLLFNEGYHGTDTEETVREDLCSEAIRLALLLTEHPAGHTPKTFALLALLCFHAARLGGRTDEEGGLLQLETQDRSLWDQALIARGFHYLEKASTGTEISAYHVEAMIASLHCAAPTYKQTDWNKIVGLYDRLYRLKPTPIVALSRAVALGKARGPDAGLAELKNLPGADTLHRYPFYPAAQAEFHHAAGRQTEAAKLFAEALKLARTPTEKNYFERKLKT